jgi:ligand-binding SRPBCC domain-containing protein
MWQCLSGDDYERRLHSSFKLTMPFIHLTTFIAAPQDRVFDLSRSVDVHKTSMKRHEEKIVDGTLTGLMNVGDTVTWTAKHLFKQRRLKIKITKLQAPEYFTDEQEEGDFRIMKHEHYFKSIQNGTIMIDQLHFETPYGWLGRVINSVYLEKHMTELVKERNATIKQIAEGNLWTQYLNR